MMLETIYAIFITLTTIATAYLALRAVYRCTTFGMMREHREVILKHAYLLDPKHDLTDAEVRSVAVAISKLYDYRYKTWVMKSALRSMEPPVDRVKLREEVRAVGSAFAALAMVENPINAISLIKKVGRLRESKQATRGKMPLARAELLLAAKLPTADPRTRHNRELAAC